ncbi:hypothetical protein ACFOEE_04545 [Pseudoalteromonas fenneropenaei]|uniref:Uncharacterized protein n=1 Tax=Pseudoalteromonas fenneropenaei TaxID=1737459 RepID=A0ABV7CGZ3_9GAMM
MQVAAWRHWPNQDHIADQLAAAIVAYQSIHQHDFIKVSCNSNSLCEAFGVRRVWQNSSLGSYAKNTSAFDIKALLAQPNPRTLHDCQLLQTNLAAHRRISANPDCKDTPSFATVYSPLYSLNSMLAGKLTIAGLALAENCAMLQRLTALTCEYIAELQTIRNVRIYYCSFHASAEFCRYPQFKKHVAHYDQQCIASLSGTEHLIHYHSAGEVYFDYLASGKFAFVSAEHYQHPVQIGALLARFTQLTFVGLLDCLLRPQPLSYSQIVHFFTELGRAVALERVLVAPACTLPLTITDTTLAQVCKIVRAL